MYLSRRHEADRVGLAGQDEQPDSRAVLRQALDADVDGVFSTMSYAGALAAYTSWPGTCLIQGFMVVAAKHKELAGRVRDRWMTEAATRLAWHPRLTDPPGFEER